MPGEERRDRSYVGTPAPLAVAVMSPGTAVPTTSWLPMSGLQDDV